jgi:hypothetical protein
MNDSDENRCIVRLALHEYSANAANAASIWPGWIGLQRGRDEHLTAGLKEGERIGFVPADRRENRHFCAAAFATPSQKKGSWLT